MRGNFGHVRNNMTQGTSPLGSMSTLKAMTEAAPMRNTVKYGSQLDDTAEGWLSAYDDEASQYFVQQSLYFKAALTEGLTFDVAGGIDYRGKERMRWGRKRRMARAAEEQGRSRKEQHPRDRLQRLRTLRLRPDIRRQAPSDSQGSAERSRAATA